MAHIVTVINQKGGVGKTTCSVEIATALAQHYGKKTLLVDLDPQASATFYVMEQPDWKAWRSTHGTTYTVFHRQERQFPIRQAIVKDVLQKKAPVFGLDLLPSDPDLVNLDLQLADFVGYTILQRAFDDIRNEYDYIICDCPPSFNPVTRNSLWASDAYVIPTVPDFLSAYGIGLLQRSISQFFTVSDTSASIPGPVLGGIIINRVRTNVKLHATYCEQIRYDYAGNVFKHTISDSIQIASSADRRLPLTAIANPRGHEAELQKQFVEVAGEFISRIHHVRHQRRFQRLRSQGNIGG